MKEDKLLVRRKRVSFQGEWEYECVVCEEWKDKERFGGCSKDVDAYGNCLMCKECRYRNAALKKQTNERDQVISILEAVGFYKYENADEWYRAMRKKHNI